MELTRREDTFSRLQVTAADGRQIEVELAQDARMLPAVELAVGAVLHLDELAADKTSALFGRAEARDLVDVNALAGRYSRERLLELAVTKDPGFDTARLPHTVRSTLSRRGNGPGDTSCGAWNVLASAPFG